MMSNCELQIVFDKPGATYEAGEAVTGEILVRVTGDVRCKRLTVNTEWRTHGRGNVTKGAGLKLIVCGATEWRPGGEYRYPFRFQAPRGPFTYRGKLLNVDWYLTARADVPWAFDPKAETEFILASSRRDDAFLGPLFRKPTGRSEDSALSLVVLLAVAGVLEVVGISIAATAFSSTEQVGFFALLFGGFSMLVGLLLLVIALRNFLAQQKLGRPNVVIEPLRARPGERFTISLKLRPRSSIRINGMSATLMLREIVVSGSGTNATTHTHSLMNLEKPLQQEGLGDFGGTMGGGAQRLDEGRELFVKTWFDLDPQADPSFAASSNQLKWTVELHIDIEGWPDWKSEYAVAVLPPREHAAPVATTMTSRG